MISLRFDCKSGFGPQNTIRILFVSQNSKSVCIILFFNFFSFFFFQMSTFNYSWGNLLQAPDLGGYFFFLCFCFFHNRWKKPQEFDLCSASCVFFHFYIAQPQLYLSLPQWGDDRVTVVWFAEEAIIPTRVTALCKFFLFLFSWSASLLFQVWPVWRLTACHFLTVEEQVSGTCLNTWHLNWWLWLNWWTSEHDNDVCSR